METHEQAALARERNKLAKRRKLQPESEKHSGDMEHGINQSMKESVKFLHWTKDPENPLKDRAIVCIICDRCIIGTEAIHKLTKEQILLHEKILSVESYEEYYETKLKSEVTKQYEVDGLKGMLLHLSWESIAMGMQSVQFVTVECKHQWQPTKLLPNLP